jgi:transcriptional regulator with XRE-family HTH domain
MKKVVDALIQRPSLDGQVSRFLKHYRGKESYFTFGRKVGVSASTLFRIETGQQSITVGTLDRILESLGLTITDVFY